MNQKFIYCVDLNNFLLCANLIRTNGVVSPLVAHAFTYKELYPIYVDSVSDIFSKDYQIGFTSPRFLNIIKADWYTQGLKVGEGLENTIFYSQSYLDHCKKISEFEKIFEICRRSINVIFPSRLCSIFLAEDNEIGREMLKNMFYTKSNVMICEVEISQKFLLEKFDSKWIDFYQESPNIDRALNYWKQLDFDKEPYYEYLLEGSLQLKNQDDLFQIKDYFLKKFPDLSNVIKT